MAEAHQRYANAHSPDYGNGNDTEERLSESSPLLDQPEDNSEHPVTTKDESSFHLPTRAAYCMLAFFLLELSNQVLTVPLILLYEPAICENYYGHRGLPGNSIDEAECKISPVQRELALLRG
ncbi:hypothetical protein BDV96DRAFT_645156 [Lophiotrema nucula]|uniref:Uncharacterized protein n=1 Tax=Lophiotrema nucula TaxID=690887 RepID=A0A6A5ZCG8_9PLEO|nr:hypothetical protein BDV96DRAFT_645156 [Lophiotrema nucula]